MAAGQAPTSSRTIWKGAISFGLVHVPVALYSATTTSGVDFDWLDKRSMDPVGYKRINKKTGQEIQAEDIVKGVKYDDGRYVVLTPEEINEAYPKTTQTIEIEAFMDADQIPFIYLEKPYYTAPINRGEKVFALLREALRETNKVGVAKVVIASKQHLAVLIPCGPGLILNLLRWGDEIRSWDALKLPPRDLKAAGVKDAEMAMAKQLIDDMDAEWDPANFQDSFREAIMGLVEQKAEAGHIENVTKLDGETEGPTGEVLDLTALLRRSLEKGGAKKAPVQLSMVAPAEPKKKPAAPKRQAVAPAKAAQAKPAPAKRVAPAPTAARGKPAGRKAA
ncbi:MAG: Ku protein [Pseudomonadota bacterium]